MAICDDEAAVCEKLESMTIKLAEELGLMISCRQFHSGEALLNTDLTEYQLLLLDIEMEGLDGMETAGKVRSRSQSLEIVFVTALAARCSEGYQYRAYRYLIKPVEYERFAAEMRGLFSRIAIKNKISSNIMESMKNQIPIYTELYFIEVIDHTVYYHSKSDTIEVTGTMKKVEELYSELGFCRIHRSYLVNMEKVEYVFADKIILENKTELLLGRKYAKEFKNQYANFMAEKLM